MIQEEMETCISCDQEKDASEFMDGKHRPNCRSCRNKRRAIWRKERSQREVINTPLRKICSTCELEKSREEFQSSLRCEDGLEAWCKDCKNIGQRQSYAKLVKRNKLAPPVIPPEKKCGRCNETKPAMEFSKHAGSPDGLMNYCKPCKKISDKESSDRQREADPVLFKMKAMCDKAHSRSKVPCDLTVEWLMEKFGGLTHCPVFTCYKLDWNVRGYASDFSPSLDKIDPELGYVKGNVRVICKKANTMKSNGTPAELLLMALHYLPEPIQNIGI